jgi:hypothetical protein
MPHALPIKTRRNDTVFCCTVGFAVVVYERHRRSARALPKAAGWHFWSVDYKTHWRSFAASARDIGAVMRDQPHDFSHTVLLASAWAGLWRGKWWQMFSLSCSSHHCHTAWGNSALGAAAQPRHVGLIALEYSFARAKRKSSR